MRGYSKLGDFLQRHKWLDKYMTSGCHINKSVYQGIYWFSLKNQDSYFLIILCNYKI